jgi:hypothetical protein
VQLGPQLGGLFVADGGEVATDAATEGEGGALGFGGVLGDRFVGAGDDALEGGGLVMNDGAERAGLAERALDERREALEVAGDAVAPAALAGDAGLLLAVALAVDGAEDVGREALEVVAVDDELVVGVDLGELAAAAAPEEQVHHDVGAGHEVAAAGGLAREAKGGREVMAQQQLLADAAVAVAGEEAGGDEEHAEAARGEQVEGAAHEVDVGAVFFVKGVGVLEGCGAAFAVGRVADDEVEGALLAAAGVGDPALERHRVELDVGADGAEELAADARELDGGPAQGEGLLGAPQRGAALGREGADEAADAGARLEGSHDTRDAGEGGEQRADGVGDRVGEDRGRVVCVDQIEGLGDEAGRELAAHGVDREAAPAGVTEQCGDLGGGELAGLLLDDELHRGEVGGGALGLGAAIGGFGLALIVEM